MTTKKPTKKQVWVTFVIFSAIWVSYFLLTTPVKPSQKDLNTAKEKEQARVEAEVALKEKQLWKKKVDAMLPILKKNKMYDKLQPEINRVYINPVMWLSMDVDEKESYSTFFMRWCEVYCAIPKIVHVFDFYSGKELAVNINGHMEVK